MVGVKFGEVDMLVVDEAVNVEDTVGITEKVDDDEMLSVTDTEYVFEPFTDGLIVDEEKVDDDTDTVTEPPVADWDANVEYDKDEIADADVRKVGEMNAVYDDLADNVASDDNDCVVEIEGVADDVTVDDSVGD